MKTKKTVMVWPIFVLTMFIIFAGCSNDKPSTDVTNITKENQVSKTGMPIVTDSITLNGFVGNSTKSNMDLSNVKSYIKYEEMSNINIVWEQATVEALDEKRNLVLAGGNLPDFFYAARIPNIDILKYGEQGTFISLNDLIDDYAPHFKEILDKNPDIRKAITFPDGNIYTLPYILDPDFVSVRTFPILYFNQEWLDQLNMDIPETTEDFYNFLTAVKSTDLNGNGKFDEIPYGGYNMQTLVRWIQGSFGVGNKGQNYIDFDNEKKQVRFYPITDQYKDMLEYIHKLYSEKLIAQNIYSIDWNQYIANASDGVYGSTVFYDPVQQFGEENGQRFVSGLPLTGPHGDRAYTLSNPVSHLGGFAITNKNKHPEATLRWADFFFGEEGLKLMFLGIEGESYEEVEDGKFEFTDYINNNPNGLNVDQALMNYAMYVNILARPTTVKQQFFEGAESVPSALAAVEKIKPYTKDDSWPQFLYTNEETRRLSALSDDIEKYVDEMQAKFITGSISFTQWDQYVKTIENMGLKEYLEIKQAAFERYNNS